MRRIRLIFLIVFLSVKWGTLLAQQIDPARGADPRLDYSSLLQFGPWDDRNYSLTLEDLALLSPDEAQIRLAVPAFFRVELRRRFPQFLRTGPSQYPHSSLPRFFVEYRGYLIDGQYYRNTTRVDDRFVIDKTSVLEENEREGRFLNGEVRVTSPNGGAESAIEINPVDSNIVIAGSNGPGGGQKMHYSSDGGDTWNQAAGLPLGGTCCDPTVDWSSDGSKAYAATLGGSQVWFYRSADNGMTWDDLNTEVGNDPRRELGSGTDKEYLHVDRFAGSTYLDNIYLTWHQGNIMQFAVSADSGHTWTSQAFSSASDQRGIGSDIATDKNGNIYYFWAAFNSQKIWVRKSTNGGTSFASSVEVGSTQGAFIFPIPSMETREVFIYVAAAADLSNGPYANSLYAAWTDSTGPTSGVAVNNHARIQVAYSRDGGSTWNVVTPHETADMNDVDRWHQWLAVGPDGTVHVIFYDTRRDPGRTGVDVFHTFSTDGAQTFSAPSRLTSVMSPNIANGFEFGDYNGLSAVMVNIIAIFTDNRSESGGVGDSIDIYAVGQQTANPIFSDGFESGNVLSWAISMF